MYKLILITLIATFLSANYPKSYAALGDVIYNNISKIESLKQIDFYKPYINDINKYADKVYKAKIQGYELEKVATLKAKEGYLNRLRTLSKTNDYFLRSINNEYVESMKNNKYELFSQIINNELINTQKNKKEIIDYYYKNKKNINSVGVIDNFLEEDARLKAKKDLQIKSYELKKQLVEEKIKGIRENDKARQIKLEEDLQKDLNLKSRD